MAREVIVTVWCDPCLADDQHTTAEELPPIQLAGGKPRVLALCEVHRKELFEPLFELFNELGQPVDLAPAVKKKPPSLIKAAEPIEGGAACPACGHVMKNLQSLRAHCRHAHEKTLAELEGEPVPYACEECPRAFASPQALGVHRARAHRLPRTTETTKKKTTTK